MKSQTRDNLIYLAVALGLVALIVADLIYSESRHTKMWMPSRFAFRAVTTPSLLAYLIAREMRRGKAPLVQALAVVLFAILLQLGIMFGLRQIIDQLPGIIYSALAVLEVFFVWQLTSWVVPYLIGIRK